MSMDNRDLNKLKRIDLLELLIAQGKEIDRLKAELAAAEEELYRRRLDINTAGSIAEAALQLNGVFRAAQAAADQYLENIRQMEEEAQKRLGVTEQIGKN